MTSVYSLRDSDSVDDDVSLLRQSGLVHCIPGIAVRPTVDQHYNDLRHSTAAAVGSAEHRTGDAQCFCDVRFSAIYVDVVDGVQQRPTVSVSVEVENDLRTAAELHQTDLRLVPGDEKGTGDAFRETEHLHVPIVVGWIADDNTCRLVKH